MNEFHHVLAEFARWFWPALLNHLWQSTIFALFVWVAVGMLRRAPANARYQLWLLALVKFCFPLVLLGTAAQQSGIQMITAPSVPTSAFIQRAASPITQVVPLAESQPFQTHPHAYCLLTGAWLAGLAFTFWLRITRSWWATRRLRLSDTPGVGPDIQLAARLSARLGIKRRIKLVVTSAVQSPCVLGWLKPILLVPAEIQNDLTEEEWEAVLVHELSHVKRCDNLVGWLNSGLCSAYWFLPTIWMIERRLRSEREFACDAAVLASGAEPKIYASGLWKVARYCLGWPSADVSHATGPNLQRRIQLMLNHNTYSRLTGAQRVTIALALFSLAGLMAFAVVFQGGRIVPRANAQSAKALRMELTDYWNAPVKIQHVMLGDQTLSSQTRLGELENWLKPLKVEAVSASEKKITFIIFAVDFTTADEKAPHIRYRFIAGRSMLAMFHGLEEESLLDLQNGQHCIAIADKTWEAQEGILEAVRKNQLGVTKAELFVETVGFADDTIWMLGTMMRPISPGSSTYEAIKN